MEDGLAIGGQAQAEERPRRQVGQLARLAVDLDAGILATAKVFPATTAGALSSKVMVLLLHIDRLHPGRLETAHLRPLRVELEDGLADPRTGPVEESAWRQLGQLARLAVDLDSGVPGHAEGFPGHRGGRLVVEGDGVLLDIDRLHPGPFTPAEPAALVPGWRFPACSFAGWPAGPFSAFTG